MDLLGKILLYVAYWRWDNHCIMLDDYFGWLDIILTKTYWRKEIIFKTLTYYLDVQK